MFDSRYLATTLGTETSRRVHECHILRPKEKIKKAALRYKLGQNPLSHTAPTAQEHQKECSICCWPSIFRHVFWKRAPDLDGATQKVCRLFEWINFALSTSNEEKDPADPCYRVVQPRRSRILRATWPVEEGSWGGCMMHLDNRT